MGGGHPEACCAWPFSRKAPRRGVRSSSPRLDPEGETPPVGPKRASPQSAKGQGVGRKPASGCRRRLCLLKGCINRFLPVHSLQRYCGATCRREAERWRRWKAAQRYRATKQGREKRKEQCRRNRKRRGKRADGKGNRVGEGHRKRRPGGLFSCDRPGCYELFLRRRRSPLQRFCCSCCRKALRRVELREARILSKRRVSEHEDSNGKFSRVTHIDRGAHLP
jgi:hypothetical protein